MFLIAKDVRMANASRRIYANAIRITIGTQLYLDVLHFVRVAVIMENALRLSAAIATTDTFITNIKVFALLTVPMNV